MAKIKITHEDGITEGRLNGHNPSWSDRRHVAVIQVTPPEHVTDGNNTVWVAASPNGRPGVGAYVNRENFLDMVSQVFDVYIEGQSGEYWQGSSF